MCFLKTLKPLDQIQDEKDLHTDDSCTFENEKECRQQFPLLGWPGNSKCPLRVSRNDQLLQKMINCIQTNNIYLKDLEKKLNQNEQLLDSSHRELDQVTAENLYPTLETRSLDLMMMEESTGHLMNPSQPLLTKLFGARKYQYKLQLDQEFPNTIFRERNINITVKLSDSNSEKVLNSNIIHLCLGICDANGRWITENKVGQNFMKGKTQIEMYHGEGSFLKVYPRDVSRHYPEGKIYFVIYAKPSMVRFSNNTSTVEKIVESNLIEPLLISDVVIKAKKC